MEHISEKHNQLTFVYAGSRALERFGYYGARTLLVLYMIEGTLGFPHEKALKIFGIFTAALVFSQVIGAVFGDLLLGNKKALIFGGIAQALGCFSLCIPSETTMYIGIALIVLGGGFYTPNILSHFGKLYLGKTKLLDSAYTLFYAAVNIGAVLGSLVLGYFADGTYAYGFALAGISILLSVLIPMFFKENKFSFPSNTTHKLGRSILMFVTVVILGGIFWKVNDITGTGTFEMKRSFAEMMDNSFSILMPSLNSLIIFLLGIAFSIIFTFFYFKRFAKLALVFLFAAGAYGMLLFIPETVAMEHFVFFLASIFLLSLAEIIIGPTILSILANYTNPKFLAIVFSLYLMCTKFFTLMFSALFFEEGLMSFLVISAISIGALGVLLGIVYFAVKK